MTSIYWPGTKIVKSKGNAFCWRDRVESQILKDKSFKQSETSKKNSAGTGTDPKKQFTIYSRAKAIK